MILQLEKKNTKTEDNKGERSKTNLQEATSPNMLLGNMLEAHSIELYGVTRITSVFTLTKRSELHRGL